MIVRMTLNELGKVKAQEGGPPPLPEAPPEALLKVYEGLEAEVVQTCEYHRIADRQQHLEHMRVVRDALAPSGRFKAWCAAAGINYTTVRNALSDSISGRVHSKLPSTPSVPAPLLPTAADEPQSAHDEDAVLQAEFMEDDERDEPAPIRYPQGKLPLTRLPSEDEAHADERMATFYAEQRREMLNDNLMEAFRHLKPRATESQEQYAHYLLEMLDFEGRKDYDGSDADEVEGAGHVLLILARLMRAKGL